MRRGALWFGVAVTLEAQRLLAQQQDATKRFVPDENTAEEITVHGSGWASPRGVGDVRVKRDLLDAAPHLQTSEMLSTAPGFFVDHEDGEGLGNDVFLRGFDLEHGNGIEMRLGSIPINQPSHVRGHGYADANFIIPELVRGVRVLGGPFDPRQGDAAIAGSAYFDLGVERRGTLLAATLGSFDQTRLVGIVAPKGMDEDTFAAVATRQTHGFGDARASQSATVNAQYGVDLGAWDHLRVLAAAYGVRAALPGVVREDDVDAGRMGWGDSYPFYAQHQSVRTARVVVGVDLDHVTQRGARVDFEPWFMWTDFRARQNFTGSVESPLGDLHETTNTESALGLTARFHPTPLSIGRIAELVVEPGAVLRAGHTDETHSLLASADLAPWDRRLDAGEFTADAAAYLDVDLRIAKRLRISGGVRLDALAAATDDRLTHASHGVGGAFVGPRATAEYQAARGLSIAASYGEGFRSRDAATLGPADAPYTRVRSVEFGVRAQDDKKRFGASLALFDTFVDEEIVFDAESGSLEPAGASTRRGLVGSLTARPQKWLILGAALSVNNALFTSPGYGRFVPGVPPILLRADASARHAVARIGGKPLVGQLRAGYTYLAPRHLSDTVTGAEAHALNAGVAARWDAVEIALDGYNLLGLRYADDARIYASNWSTQPGSQPATVATHLSAAAPTTILATVALSF